ncbi:MAG: hypothetical protein ACOY4K_14270 [Pseudomonadota bacterium]
MRPIVSVLAVAGLVLAAAPAAQAAAKRMVTYDSASPTAKRLTGAGLTFVFTKSWMRTRILAVRATAVAVGVTPRLSTDGAVNRKLDALMGEDAGAGTLYEIDPDAEEGRVMIRAFCPGSKSGWLAIGTIAFRRDLRVHAFGDDPATGEPRLCATMDFSFRSEWRMPGPENRGVTERITRPDYGRRPGT